MPFKMVVLIKQVPDTKNITAKAMNDDGTVNRSALPAIFNPEDLNALEMALQVRDAHGGHVTVVTMGPPSAAAALREALMRGADAVALLSDRAFAVADTLATAYALGCAIRRIGRFDLLFCGRQAIDGDTAQVGPQLAGALDVPQVTYACEILHLDPGRIRVRRLIEGGHEIVECTLPALLTVVGQANEPRPRRAKRVAQFKRARSPLEVREAIARQLDPEKGKPDPALLKERVDPIVADLQAQGLLIPVWAPADVGADVARCGAAGSPTKVKTIESIVLVATDHKRVEPTKEAIAALIHELAEEHIFD